MRKKFRRTKRKTAKNLFCQRPTLKYVKFSKTQKMPFWYLSVLIPPLWSRTEKEHKHKKNWAETPPPRPTPQGAPDPAKSLCWSLFYFQNTRTYIKNFEGGSWGPQNSLWWISSRVFFAPDLGTAKETPKQIPKQLGFEEKTRHLENYPCWNPFGLCWIAVSIAFLFRVYFKRGLRHYSATIVRLGHLSGLERGHWELLCAWMRDRARWGLPIAFPVAEGVL